MDRPFFYRAGADVPRDVTSLTIGGSVRVVPPMTFEGYKYLKRVRFEDGVEEIGALAFHNCPNLTFVDCRASSLRTIDNLAFSGCEMLRELMLREGLQRIGRGAFSSCKLLRRITVPSSVVDIGEQAFYQCLRLLEVILQEGLRQIGKAAFAGCGLRRIIVPSSVVEIGEQVFFDCKRLLEVILQEGLRWIRERAFTGCDLVRRITVPSSVVEIGQEAFSMCCRLSEVTLAGGMVLLARGAFSYCHITISSMAIVVEPDEDGNSRVAATGGIHRDHANKPARLILASPRLASMPWEERTNLTDAIYRIADAAQGSGPLDLADGDVSTRIRECFIKPPPRQVDMDEPIYYLSAEDPVPRDAVRVIIGGAITAVAPGTFRGFPNLRTVEIQQGVVEIGTLAFAECPNLTRLDASQASSLRTIGEGAFGCCERLSELILREGLEEIGDQAFYGCGLRQVSVPSSVLEIGRGAFADCKRLWEVVLREGLQRIRERAFSRCGFEWITIPSSVMEIGVEAFFECKRLWEVVLREGLRWIRARAFKKCALRRITVPSSVVEIGEQAFSSRERLLEVILQKGLRWIREEAFEFCALKRITVPSSVVEIGENIFWGCIDLKAATLAGGMVMATGNAFFNFCPRPEWITIFSVAIVVEDGKNGSGQAAVETGGAIVRTSDRRDGNGNGTGKPTRLILTSPYLASMSFEDITKAKDAIDRIAGNRPPGEGPLDLAVGDGAAATEDDWVRVRKGADRIRARFLGLLSAHRREMASNVLERALGREVAGVISSFLPDVEG